MTFPEWADEELSLKLPKLRAQGEGQALEFKRELGKAGDEIKKEIAALASTNAGLILIGVDDDGTLVGIPDIESAKEREQFRAQVEGRARGVTPPITPALKYLLEDGKVVLAVEVKRGPQPIYYSNNIPYVRHITQAHPAAPQEVIDRVKEWLDKGGDVEGEKQKEFLSSVAEILIGIIVFGIQYGDRTIKPWVDNIKYTFQSYRNTIGQLAASQMADELECVSDLTELADALDKVTTHYWTLGNGSEQLQNVAELVAKARKLKTRLIDPASLDSNSKTQIRDLIKQKSRELQNLTIRAEDMAFRRIDDLKEEASNIGQILAKLSQYDLTFIEENLSSNLLEIASPLHLVETASVYMDGGNSQRKIVWVISESNTKLAALVNSLKI